MAEIKKLPIELLQRRLRALIIVGSMLGPAFCVFGVLAFLADGWVRWVGLSLWAGMGLVMGLWLARLLRTLAAIDESGR